MFADHALWPFVTIIVFCFKLNLRENQRIEVSQISLQMWKKMLDVFSHSDIDGKMKSKIGNFR